MPSGEGVQFLSLSCWTMLDLNLPKNLFNLLLYISFTYFLMGNEIISKLQAI